MPNYKSLEEQLKDAEKQIEYYKNIAAQAGAARLKENEEFTKLIARNRQAESELKNANEEIKKSIETLKNTQEQLIESEKNAALSGLVAGVAHEINTPIGLSITAASHLDDASENFFKKVTDENLSKLDFEAFQSATVDSTNILLSNLSRAADLIKSFKQVAVDQSSENKRIFKLKEYIEELLKSLRPEYKRVVSDISVLCDKNIEIDSYPGILSQILTNLVMNSLIHGFEGRQDGKIAIRAFVEEGELIIDYSDNGKGMDSESLNKIFDPFYTTKRGSGGTGLGMHIVYNLVNQKLGGSIKCASSPNQGINIHITIPV
jgi:signal transduction histidine kinase